MRKKYVGFQNTPIILIPFSLEEKNTLMLFLGYGDVVCVTACGRGFQVEKFSFY